MSVTNNIAVVILAAGKGKRMKNPDMAKVMYEVGSKPMISYVVELSKKINPARLIIVVGWQRQMIIDYFKSKNERVEFAEQLEQLGTGHAVMQTQEFLKNFTGLVLILSGDVPLLTYSTVKRMIDEYSANNADAVILTTEMDDPTGYGRIVRGSDNAVLKIVEHKDAEPEILKIKEINSGIYLFDTPKLFEALKHLKPDNAQNEYYLTDVFEYFWKNKYKVIAVKSEDPLEIMGINDATQLELARKIFEKRTHNS